MKELIRMENGVHHDWSELGSDMLGHILGKLSVVDEFVRFGAVCVSWQSVFASTKQKKGFPPFLVIPYKEGMKKHRKQIKRNYSESDKANFYHNHDPTRSFYSLQRRRVYSSFRLQVPHNKFCSGSCFGWLITTDFTGPQCYAVQLFNPFLSQTINLPSLGTLVDAEEIKHRKLLSHYLQKAVLSASPSSDTTTRNYTAAAIVGFNARLALLTPGSGAWIPIDWAECKQCKYIFDDVIYFNKTKQFYAVENKSRPGAVFAIDIESPNPKLMEVAPPTKNHWVNRRFLVESSAGDLLQVYEILSSFEVFKFDPVSSEWMQIYNLGNNTLFLGDNSSISISSTNVNGIKSNCIYYTIPHTYNVGFRFYRPTANGIFDLEHGTFEPYYKMHDTVIYTQPIWLEPTLQ